MASLDPIAIYGAILSTVAIVWNIYRDLKNRPSLIISGKVGTEWIMSSVEYPVVEITIANSGRRPVTVVTVGWKATSTKDWITFPEEAIARVNALPKSLSESEVHTVAVNQVHIGNPQIVEFLFARDSTGKIYRSRRMPLTI